MTQSIFSSQYRHFRLLLISSRKAKGLTQESLARLINRPQSFISKSENGERRIDLIEFLEIMDALEMDPCEVVQSLIKFRSEIIDE